jgi:hypothetical protein
MARALDEKEQFIVLVDDNYHDMDESERWTARPFADCGAAIDCCKRIVDEWLRDAYKPGMSAKDLYGMYTLFGEDSSIRVEGEAKCRFSAWDYALHCAVQMWNPENERPA